MLSIRKAMEGPPLGYFLHRAPSPTCYPPPGPLGPPWKLPRTIFILHLRRSIRTTCITLLFYFNWIWRRSLTFAKFWPLGPSPWAPMVATCTIWTPLNPQPLRMIPAKFRLKSNHAFLQAVDEQFHFLYRAPSPTCYPHGGHWGHPGKCHQQPLFFT